MEINKQSEKASIFDVEIPMRFYFNVQDELKIEDEVGRDFAVTSQAINFAKNLAADIRCLEPIIRPQLAIEVIGANSQHIHREKVFPQA